MTELLVVSGEGAGIPEMVGSGAAVSAVTLIGERSRDSRKMKPMNFRIARISE
jgi:hypothetical protein